MPIYALPYAIYQPAVRDIVSISQEENALVVTSFDNGYISGTIVRIDVPLEYGMQQINHLTGTISVIDAISFHINIDTRTFSPFIVPIAPTQVAQVVPIGEEAYMFDAALKNVLPFTV